MNYALHKPDITPVEPDGMTRPVYSDSEHPSKTIIKGEQKYGANRSKKFIVEILPEAVVLWVIHPHENNPELNEYMLFIYYKKRGDIWVNRIKTKKETDGTLFTTSHEGYICAKNSFKCFLTDLFLTQPNNLILLELIDEVNNPMGQKAHSN